MVVQSGQNVLVHNQQSACLDGTLLHLIRRATEFELQSKFPMQKGNELGGWMSERVKERDSGS